MGFMAAADVAGYLTGYAESFRAPVRQGTAVLSVRRHAGRPGGRHGGRYLIDTDAGSWAADAVVIATGFCDQPSVPAAAGGLDPSIHQVTQDQYRNPRISTAIRPSCRRAVCWSSVPRRPARNSPTSSRPRAAGAAGRRPAHPVAPPVPGVGRHVVVGPHGAGSIGRWIASGSTGTRSARRRSSAPDRTQVLAGDMVALWPDGDVQVDAVAFQERAEEALSARDASAAGLAADRYRGDLLPEDPTSRGHKMCGTGYGCSISTSCGWPDDGRC